MDCRRAVRCRDSSDGATLGGGRSSGESRSHLRLDVFHRFESIYAARPCSK
jgi:hypothetical protein